MNLDFHYYGTYLAAIFAGYDSTSAECIAYAAQYVDDSSIEMLKDERNNYYISDFTPVPTIETNRELAESNFNWSEQNLNETIRTWTSFHFLPSNYGTTLVTQDYTGLETNNGYLDSWQYDDESKEQFKLLCLPNNELVEKMINDIIENHKGTSYELHMIGLRMHVLADTWAHMYYAGIPAWFINNVHQKVYDCTGSSPKEIKWFETWSVENIYNGEACTPALPAYNSYSYLGHGRMGHLPDYPWIKYMYTPQWSKKDILKDNPKDFMSAFKQMVTALRCIRERSHFSVNIYEDIGSQIEKQISRILNTQTKDQSSQWFSYILHLSISNPNIKSIQYYEQTDWLNTMKKSTNIKQTDYYNFNYAAACHLNFVKTNLKDAHIFLDEIPNENIVKIKLKNSNNFYVGSVEKIMEYYPKMDTASIELNIIKANNKPLKSGDIVKIKTTEDVKGYTYLGAWKTTSLYYYSKDYSNNKQKWKIEKINGSIGEEIKFGDTVSIKNQYSKSKPYLIPYDWHEYGQYLTTSKETNTNTHWIIELYDPLVDKYFNIIAKHSGKFLDVQDASKKDSAKLIQFYENNSADNQKFRFIPCGDGYYNIVAKHSGKFLDVQGASKENSANIVQFHDNGGDNQKFKLIYCEDGYYNIVAKHSGKYLDVQGGSKKDSADIIQFYENNGCSNQKFKIVPA